MVAMKFAQFKAREHRTSGLDFPERGASSSGGPDSSENQRLVKTVCRRFCWA
jgi:hypothetical protein